MLLVPASVVIALVAEPVTSLLIPAPAGLRPGGGRRGRIRMLAVFAPQMLLYGLAVVLYGILQAHRKFTAPALAPVLSSLVVIAAYVAFVPLGGAHTTDLVGLPTSAELHAVGRDHGGRRRPGAHRAGARRSGCGSGCAPRSGSRRAWPAGRGTWPRSGSRR